MKQLKKDDPKRYFSFARGVAMGQKAEFEKWLSVTVSESIAKSKGGVSYFTKAQWVDRLNLRGTDDDEAEEDWQRHKRG